MVFRAIIWCGIGTILAKSVGNSLEPLERIKN